MIHVCDVAAKSCLNHANMTLLGCRSVVLIEFNEMKWMG